MWRQLPSSDTPKSSINLRKRLLLEEHSSSYTTHFYLDAYTSNLHLYNMENKHISRSVPGKTSKTIRFLRLIYHSDPDR